MYSLALVRDDVIISKKAIGSSGSPCPAYQYACNKVSEFLRNEGDKYECVDLVLTDVPAFLSDLKRWHDFTLAWGSVHPLAEHSECPNGRDIQFTLWKNFGFGSKQREPIFVGVLPDGWWDLDEDDQWELVE